MQTETSSSPASSAQSFRVTAQAGQARCGILEYSTPSSSGSVQLQPIETPALCLNTYRGMPHNITLDLLATLDLPAVQISGAQLARHPDPDHIAKHGGGAHGFLGIPGHNSVFMTTRDPTTYEFVQSRHPKALTVQLHCGRIPLDPPAWDAIGAALRPQMMQSLADEVPITVNFMRHKHAVAKTLELLDAQVGLRKERGAGSHAPALWASLCGGSHVSLWTESARESAQREGIEGFALCGLGTGELPEERRALMEAACAALPQDKPRMVPGGVSGPLEILDAVRSGVDLLATDCASRLTLNGSALCFPTDLTALEAAADRSEPMDLYLNLWDAKFTKDTRPLVEGCGCHACRRHNRAYLHHLLECHEMLSEVLLDLHNFTHLARFMESVREAIRRPDGEKLLEKIARVFS